MALISSSKLAMLKTIMALAWVDGKVAPEERQRLEEFIDGSRYLSDTQRESLKSALIEKRKAPRPVNIDALWEQITDKQDRARLIDIALSIFNADRDYAPAERALYEKLYENHLTSLDMGTIKNDIAKAAAEAKARFVQEEQAYVEEIKKRKGFRFVPGVNEVELLLYRIDKALGSK